MCQKSEFSLELMEVKKYYKNNRKSLKAVDGVSLKINSGEIVGLVGESGCGKTTIAKLMLNLELPTEGTVMFQGKDLNNLNKNVKNETITILLNSKISSRWPYKSMAEIFQQQWKQLGLDVKIEMVDGGLWSERLKKGDYDITLAPFTIMSGEPNSFFSQHMLSTGSDNKLRSYGYNNPEADKLIRLAASEMDNSKRKAMYDKLQVIASNEGPLVPLFHDVSIYAVNKKVKNFTLDHSFRADLYGVDISE